MRAAPPGSPVGAGDALRELCGAAVVRSRNLTRRLRLDIESDLTSVKQGPWRARGEGGAHARCGGLVARASLEGSQQLGGSCLASAALGANAADPAAGLAWGVAVERMLRAARQPGGGKGGGAKGGGPAEPPPWAKLSVRLFCERSFGQQLLLQAQQLVGASDKGFAGDAPPPPARWVDARYVLHACGGSRSAVLRCALLGGGHPESPVALSHWWRAGHSTGRGAVSVDSRWSAGGSVRGPGSGGSGGSSGGGGGGEDGDGPARAEGGAAPASGGSLPGTLGSGGATAAGGGSVAAAAATAGAASAAGSAQAAAARRGAARHAQVLTLPPPQPRWEIAAAATYGGGSGGGGGWACSLQVLVHRGERIEWEWLPGQAPPAGSCF
jgi:hypothetical protein